MHVTFDVEKSPKVCLWKRGGLSFVNYCVAVDNGYLKSARKF